MGNDILLRLTRIAPAATVASYQKMNAYPFQLDVFIRFLLWAPFKKKFRSMIGADDIFHLQMSVCLAALAIRENHGCSIQNISHRIGNGPDDLVWCLLNT